MVRETKKSQHTYTHTAPRVHVILLSYTAKESLWLRDRRRSRTLHIYKRKHGNAIYTLLDVRDGLTTLLRQ